jgi:hypothetical protein
MPRRGYSIVSNVTERIVKSNPYEGRKEEPFSLELLENPGRYPEANYVRNSVINDQV